MASERGRGLRNHDRDTEHPVEDSPAHMNGGALEALWNSAYPQRQSSVCFAIPQPEMDSGLRKAQNGNLDVRQTVLIEAEAAYDCAALSRSFTPA